MTDTERTHVAALLSTARNNIDAALALLGQPVVTRAAVAAALNGGSTNGSNQGQCPACKRPGKPVYGGGFGSDAARKFCGWCGADWP